MSRRRDTKEELLEHLGRLLDAAMRAEAVNGRHEDDGSEVDSNSWRELRQECLRAKYCLKRNGALRHSYRATAGLPTPPPPPDDGETR